MAWVMPIVALALFGWFVVAPPELPPDIGDVPPRADNPPAEPAEPPADAPSDPPADAPSDPPADAPSEPPADSPSADDDAIAVTPAEEPPPEEPATDDDDDRDDAAAAGGAAAGGAGAGGAAAGGAAAGGAAAGGAGAGGAGAGGAGAGGAGSAGGAGAGGAAVQRPGSAAVQKPGGAGAQSGSTPSSAQTPARASGQTPPTEGPAPAGADEAAADPEAEPEPETYRKLGGFRLFRIGVAAKIGYMHGTSNKNGLFDRDKSIQDSINNGTPTMSGAGDLGKTKYGGPQFGFILDAEVVGINVWLDFHKFFTPGGNWALLLGYDHEFGFGKRLRLDVGAGFGMHKAFLGSALSGLYYDKSNPAAINIGTLGIEARGMVDLHIKIVGPLFTGPYAMVGYHYLWSANAAEVTAEKGLHYSLGWTLRLDFAAPKLIGGKKTKKAKPAA